jgi:hypothetical protein
LQRKKNKNKKEKGKKKNKEKKGEKKGIPRIMGDYRKGKKNKILTENASG